MNRNYKKRNRLLFLLDSLDVKLRSLLLKITCLSLLPLVTFLYISVARGNFLNVLNCSISLYLSIYINKSVQGRG